MAVSNRVYDGYGISSAADNSFVSNPIDKRNCYNGLISVVFTGTQPVGTLTLETSADIAGSGVYSQSAPLKGDDWDTVPNSTLAVSSSATPNSFKYHWDIGTGAHWIRVRYTASSNVTGTVSILENFVIVDRG